MSEYVSFLIRKKKNEKKITKMIWVLQISQSNKYGTHLAIIWIEHQIKAISANISTYLYKCTRCLALVPFANFCKNFAHRYVPILTDIWMNDSTSKNAISHFKSKKFFHQKRNLIQCKTKVNRSRWNIAMRR